MKPMLHSKKLACLALVFLLVIPLLLSSQVAGQDDAAANISAAKTELSNCYASVKAAEAQGANVTGLIATLNDAGELLTRAELAYLAKDYDSAANFTQQSKDTLDGFNQAANSLKADAMQSGNSGFFTDALLVVASLVIFCVGIAVWVALRSKQGSVSAE
jgi:hypothetical protein